MRQQVLDIAELPNELYRSLLAHALAARDIIGGIAHQSE